MRALVSVVRAFARELLRHPWQLGLTLVGIALGVAVVVAIGLASESAQRGFVISSDAVMGRTTHVVEGPSRGVPARALRALRSLVPPPIAAPVVQARVTLGGEPATLLGVDPLSEAGVRDYRSGSGAGAGRLLRAPRGALLARAAAQRLGLARGEPFTVRTTGRAVPLTLAGFLDPGPGRSGDGSVPAAGGSGGLARLVVVDIALAQSVLGMTGRFSRIDLVLPAAASGAGAGPATLAAIRAVLPPSTRVESAGARAAARREMTRGFEINLRMLSLLSLALGALLVYNTTSFSVARRRRLIGTLRALGVTQGEVLGALLTEAVLIGIAGSALGVGLGWWLATRLVVLVTRTVSDLYFATEVSRTALTPGAVLAALALGIGCSVLSAAWPAWRAAGVVPRIALLRSSAERTARAAPKLALLGTGCLLGAYALVSEPMSEWFPAAGLGLGYVALLAALTGSALLAPGALVLAVRLALRVLRRWRAPVVRPALRGVTAEIGRTSVAVTALMVALATTVGVTVMVGSFRHAVERWLAGTLRADLYLTTVGGQGAPVMTDPLAGALRTLPGVAHLSLGRWARVNGSAGAVQVLALRPAPASLAGFDLIDARGSPWARFERGDGVLVSEPFAFRHRLRVGDRVRLRGEAGMLERPVLAIFRDYRSEAGFVLMARSLYDRYWSDPGYTGIGVYLEAGARTAEVRRAIEGVLREAGGGLGPATVDVRSNRDLREASLAIFDRTFAVTEVLRAVSALVAFVAVLSALLALELDRARERALMRALGYTRAQTLALVEIEGLAQGVLAGLLALPTGLALSWLLIAVINRRSFGWSMAMHVDPLPLAGTVLAAAAAAALAGLYPAWRAARGDPARALREE